MVYDFKAKTVDENAKSLLGGKTLHLPASGGSIYILTAATAAAAPEKQYPHRHLGISIIPHQSTALGNIKMVI